MNLTKSQSITLAVGSIVIFFCITALAVNKNTKLPSSNSSTQAIKREQADSLPTPAVTPLEEAPSASSVQLNQFHRSESKNGKKLWEVQAEQGQYFPESAKAKLSNATLWVYQKDGERTQLQAKEATLHMNGPTLTQVEASGRVVVTRNDQVTIETENATYNREKGLVTAPGFVQIKSATFDTEGTHLEAYIDTKEVRLLSDVSSVVKPRPAGEKGTTGKDKK